MRFGLEPSQDLGLQHALRNGVAILSGADFEAARREQVLGGLLELVSEADRGSEALQGQTYTFAMDEGAAFDQFSLFVKYLGDSVQDIGHRLAQAKAVLEGVGAGAEVRDEDRALVADLLKRLIESIDRERAHTPMVGPKEYNFG